MASRTFIASSKHSKPRRAHDFPRLRTRASRHRLSRGERHLRDASRYVRACGWSSATRFPLAAGALGLVWNLGYLLITLQELGLPEMSEYFDALTYSALALLPAAVVHSILREQSRPAARVLRAVGYLVSGVASVGHFANVALNGFAPLPEAAHFVGPIYGFLLVPLVLLTGSHDNVRHTITRALKDLEARLDPKRFIRRSRGALVHLESIQSVSPMPGGTYVVTLYNQKKLPVSRQRSKVLREQFLKL